MLKPIGQALVLIILAAVVGLATNAIRPDSLPLVQDWNKTLAGRAENSKPAELLTINLAQLRDSYRNPKVLLLDARSRPFYELEHIPGARSVPVSEADKILPGLLRDLPESTRIITYCDGLTCPNALKLARKIIESGRKNVALYPGGFEEWSSENQPVESDEKK